MPVRAHDIKAAARKGDAFAVKLKRFAVELVADQADRAARNEFSSVTVTNCASCTLSS
jgi:hypothetical protein